MLCDTERTMRKYDSTKSENTSITQAIYALQTSEMHIVRYIWYVLPVYRMKKKADKAKKDNTTVHYNHIETQL